MIPLLLMILAAGLIAAIAGLIAARRARRKGETLPPPRAARPDGCCGQHEVCEKELLIAAATATEADYFADEELDAYRGRESHAYSPDEEEAFREVLYTMRPDEVPAWVRALQVRGIALPGALTHAALILRDRAAQPAARPAGV